MDLGLGDGGRERGVLPASADRGLHLLGWELPGAPGPPGGKAPRPHWGSGSLTTIPQRHPERCSLLRVGAEPTHPQTTVRRLRRAGPWALGPAPSVRPDSLRDLSSLHRTKHRTTHSTSLTTSPPPASPRPPAPRRSQHSGHLQLLSPMAGPSVTTWPGPATRRTARGFRPGHPPLQDLPCTAKDTLVTPGGSEHTGQGAAHPGGKGSLGRRP